MRFRVARACRCSLGLLARRGAGGPEGVGQSRDLRGGLNIRARGAYQGPFGLLPRQLGGFLDTDAFEEAVALPGEPQAFCSSSVTRAFIAWMDISRCPRSGPRPT